MLIAGLILQFVSFVCYVSILVRAFDDSWIQGLLNLCLLPYTLYYAFARMQGKRKGVLIGGFLGGAIIGFTLTLLGAPSY